MMTQPVRAPLSQYYREAFKVLSEQYPDFDPLTFELFLNLIRTGDRFRALIEKRCRRWRLTGPAVGVLSILDFCPGGQLSMREIGNRMLASPANLTGLVDTLEKQNLVRRVRSSSDRRVTQIQITTQGRGKLKKFRPGHFRFLQDFFGAFPPVQKKALTHLLEKVQAEVERWTATLAAWLLMIVLASGARGATSARPENLKGPQDPHPALSLQGEGVRRTGEGQISLFDSIREALAKSPEVRRAQEELKIVSLEEPNLLALTDPTMGLRTSIQDDRGPRALPAFQGAFAKTQALDLNVSRYWLIGTEAQMFFRTQRTDSPAIFRPINPSVDSRFGLDLRQPLLKNFWGRPDIARRRHAQARVASAERRLARAKEEAALRAASSYVDAFAARENIRIREAALQDARRLRDKYLEKKPYGLVEDSDILQAEASVRVQETELRLARLHLVQSENALRAALYRGSDPRPLDPLSLPVPSSHAPPAPEDAIAQAFSQRSDFQAALKEVERADWFLAVERLATLPDLSAFGSYAYAGLKGSPSDSWRDTTSFNHPIASGGLELRVPWGGKREQLRREEARRRLDLAKADVDRLDQQIRREVLDALEALETAKERVVAYRKLLEIEKRKLSAGEEDFHRGRVTTDLLIRFQGDIHRAESLLLQSEADVLKTWAALAYATGRLLESLEDLPKTP